MTRSTHAEVGYAVTRFAARVGDRNARATGASAAIAAELARRTSGHVVEVGEPASPQPGDWRAQLEAARPDLGLLALRMEQMFEAGLVPLTASSRCSASLATLPAVARAHPNAAIIWLDAHPDLHTPSTTESGYLGGLALSGPVGMWDSGLGAGLSPDRVVLAGVRDIDDAEHAAIARHGIRVVGPGPGFTERLADTVDGRAVYIHVDCDVVRPGELTTELRVEGGITLAELRDAVDGIAAHGVVGVEIAELEAARTEHETRAQARALVETMAAAFSSS
jgi:arginase family enzyme